MAHQVGTDAIVTLLAVALCGALVVPLLTLSFDDGLLALSAWLIGITLSYAAVVVVTRRPSYGAVRD
jgi:hypothetical protein